jgi:hypothetical protein
LSPAAYCSKEGPKAGIERRISGSSGPLKLSRISKRVDEFGPGVSANVRTPLKSPRGIPRGRIYERTAEGVEHDWGEVLDWEPPRRLRYLWHLRFDRADATEVEIVFAPAGEGTDVTITHRGWERLGAKGPERRERNRRGWDGLIPHYRQACAPAG